MARGRDYATILFGALGISFAPILLVLSQVDPTPAAVWRFVWALPVLVPVCLIRASSSFRVRDWIPSAILSGVFFACDMALWHRSIGLIGAGPATLVVNTQVIWIALFGMVALRERPARAFWLALPVTFSGLALLSGGEVAGVPDETRLPGLAMGLGAGVAYAGALICLRRAGRSSGSAPEAVLLVQLATAGPLLSLLGTAEGTLQVLPHAWQHLWLALLGLGPQAVAWLLITRGIAGLPGHHGGLVLLLQPIASLVLGWLILEQALGARAVAGAALTLVGIGAVLLAERTKQG